MAYSALYFIEQFCFMLGRFFLTILVLAGLLWGVAGWCEKTHFYEISGNKTNEVDISPDRSMMLTASDSMKMIVWNFTSLAPLFILNCTVTVQSAKFSKDGTLIAVAQGANSVNIIQVSTFTSIKNISSSVATIKEVDFSWDNTKLLVCGQNGIEVWNVGGTWSNNGSSTTGQYTSCKFQKNNSYFGGDSTGKNTLFNANTNAVIWSDQKTGPSLSVDFDMVNQSLLVVNSGGGKSVYVYPSIRWPTGGGTTQTTASTLTFPVNINCVAFAKEGSVYALGFGSFAAVYENSTNNLLFNISGTGSVISTVFSYDSQYFVTGSSTGLIKIFKRNCQSCPAGTYEKGDGCPLCSTAMAGCLNCANSTYCYICGDGYAFDSVNKNCTLCHNTMPGCILCNTTTICTACNSYYYLTSNNCTSCQSIPNCLTCSGPSTCTRCNSNLYLDGTSKLCVACTLTGCLNCYNNTACLNCLTGYYFVNTTLTCTRCAIANCTDCNASTTCQQCMDTYFLTSTFTCSACPANCLACTSTACTRCQIGYYASGTGCLVCASPCVTCTAANTCTTCIPGYFFSAGACSPCSNGCVTCTSSTACLSCNVNYYLSGTTCNKCQLLMAGCLHCTSTACLRCDSEYYFDGTSCLKCAISNGCQTCTTANFCLSCLSGYMLNAATGVCSACGTGCSSCSNSSVCINCLPKYYFSNGSCVACPATCPTCTSGTSCLSCIQGYYLNGSNACLTCNAITNCVSCTSASYCTSCELGFRLSATNTSCVRCAWPCSLCNASQCVQCATGYYLATGVCTICPATCSSCIDNTICYSCVDGYYLTSSNTCTSCLTISAGCSECTSTTCLTCLTNLGYYINSGTCNLCSSIANCLQCSSGTTCTTCSFGYYVSAGACSACTNLVSNCQSCTATACLACISPYFLSGSTCQLCPEGCSTCTSSTACGTCLSGYLLQSGLCTYCDTLMNGCQICTSSTVCTECADGYLVSGTSCASCNSLLTGCQFCSVVAGSNVCQTCMDQYYMNGGSCLKCDSMAGCSQCNSSSVCLSCQTGYFKSAANACTKCADPMCTVCTDATTCISCLSGFYLNGGSCSTCSSNFTGCVLCNNTQCLQCQSGYYLNAALQCAVCLVNGCQICNVLQPTQCVTCSSLYYLTNTSTCATCNSSMNGCISCSSSTHCLKCMVGSYLSASFTCLSCFSLFNGCGECTASGCTACQGGYLIGAGGVCSTCISSIPGCLYCTSSTVCLSCQSGYYKSGNTCASCGGIAGCLDCLSATACNLCADTYYLNPTDNLCYVCNTTIDGCISCASQTTCKACHGNYALSGGSCTALKSTSSQPYEELRLVTEYLDKNRLLHRLLVRGTFNVQAVVNLTQSSTITMVGAGNISTQLTIYSYEWVSQYEVNFITNNPIGADLNSIIKVMPPTRLLSDQEIRLLADSVNLNYNFKLDMTEQAVQAILPDATHLGVLSLSNPAENPSFIRSVYTQLPFNYHYFGLIVTLLMFIHYLVKAAVSVPQSDDQGEIISHVFLLRCGGVVFSLVYMEYMDYCFGFLSPDLPWLNELTASLTASADLSPNSYLLFYDDMTIASSYLSSLCLIFVLIITLVLIGVFCRQKREGLKVVGVFLFNFFQVGLIMAGSMSIQGAYYNNLNYITSNTIFYVMGIVLFVVVALTCIWMALDSMHRINKVRVLVKTTFLSLLYVSPIYLLPIAMGMELIFIIAEFNIKKTVKLHPHLWLTNQIIVNLALVSLIMLSDSKLSLVIPSVLISVALGVDLFIHIKEYRHQQELVKVKEIQKLTSLMETQEKLNRTIKRRNNDIYEKNKMSETGSSSSHNITQDFLFNVLDQDLSSSKSPFHNHKQQPVKKEPAYIFDEVSESKEQ